MKITITALVLSLFLANAFANQNVGTVVKIKGEVKIFTHPGNKILGPAPRVLFEKKYYSFKNAKLGDKLLNGHIIQTGAKAKARVIFRNGDQIFIGEGTAYKINWLAGTKKSGTKSVLNLIRGQFRAIVSKKGPRNNLKIKSKQASLAIRGTDFYVMKIRDSIKLSVVRGKVSISTNEQDKIVKSGKSAIARKKVVVYNTSKKELLQIHKNSIIKIKKEERPKISRKTANTLIELEKQAINTTLSDIKSYDDKQFQKISAKKVKSISSLNAMVIKDSFKEAPDDNKFKIEDFLEEEPYRKYFKIED